MRALWLEDGRLRPRADLPPPAPAAGEALVRVSLAGICGTDLELVKGYYPFTGVPGHEFVGVVESAPDGPGWLGRRVVGEINAACGACAACRAGRRAHCAKRTVLGLRGRDGAFAETLTLPLSNLHVVPQGMPDEVAVFTEPSAAALRVVEQVPIGPGDGVVVLGGGRLGCLVAQALHATGAQVTLATRRPGRAAWLAARGLALVATGALPAGQADAVVDCTGSPDGLPLALRAVRPLGTVVLKSTYHGLAPVNLSALVVDEVRLVGSRCGPFAPALSALAGGTIATAPLLEARYPLERALAAFEHAARPGALKVLIEVGPRG